MYAFYKKRVGKIALLLVLAMLLTGTFAWSSFSQRAFNPAWEDGNYGGRIRDEYDGEGSGDHNKDVFAENFGSRNIFVRVRLREFLAINGAPVIAGSQINNPSTWPIYQSEPNDVNTPLAGSAFERLHGPIADGGYGIGWTLGHDVNSTDPNRGPKYFMPTHNHAIHLVEEANIDGAVTDLFAHTNAFQMSEATGNGRDAIAAEARYGRFDEAEMTSAEDFWEIGLPTGPGDGSHDYWGPGDVHTADLIYTTTPTDTEPVELRNRGPVEHTAQRTLEPSIYLPTNVTEDSMYNHLGERPDTFTGIMTMHQWTSLSRPAGNFWILDSDGWFYWNGWLPAGEATSLLLDAIYLPERNEAWEHIIEVEADFFSPDSLEELRDTRGMTDVAFSIFDGIPPLARPLPPVDGPGEEPILDPLTSPRSLVIMRGGASNVYENALHFSSGASRFEEAAAMYAIYVDGQEAVRHIDERTTEDGSISARAFNLDILDLEPGTYYIQVRAIPADSSTRAASGLSVAVEFVVE